MIRTRSIGSFARALVLVACCALLAVGGCRRRPGMAPVVDDPAVPAPVEKPAPAAEPPAPAPEPAPAAEPEPEPAPALRVAILTSGEAQQYVTVRDELVSLAGPANISLYRLDDDPARTASVIADLRASEVADVVAIGLPAALATRELGATKVVFCQVLNHEDHGLIRPTARGVETIPDLTAAIDLWKALDPDLRRIGLITGEGHERRIAEARAALATRGVELVHRVTRSDKETLVEFRRILSGIDGYWMFPDNRVLSLSTIREIMSIARRSRTGVLANDPGFHQIGAFICAAHSPEEVAHRALGLLEEARDDAGFSGRAITPLSGSVITVRADVAEQLGYAVDSIPPDLLAR